MSRTSPLHQGQAVDQRRAGLGEGHGRHVVGHPGPQGDDGDAGRPEAQLQGGLDPGRHLELALDQADPGDQVGRLHRAGGRQLHRPGVGGRGREGAQPDDHPGPPDRARLTTASTNSRQWKSGSGPTR